MTSAVIVLPSNFPFAELKTNPWPSATLATSTFVNEPNEILDDGATTTDATVVFDDLTDTADFNDSIYRYSYLSKNETKDIAELRGIRLTQSKIPKADKTKQEQKKRTIKKTG